MFLSSFCSLKFQITKHDDGHVDIFLSQEAATNATKLIQSSGLSNDSTSTKRTPYRIPMESDLPLSERQRLQNQLQTIVGSLNNWLSIQTRPDIATIHHQHHRTILPLPITWPHRCCQTRHQIPQRHYQQPRHPILQPRQH